MLRLKRCLPELWLEYYRFLSNQICPPHSANGIDFPIPYFLDGSRPYRGSAHAPQRLSMPPTVQPPTSSPCVSSGCRHPERGFKLLSKQASTWRTIHGLGPVSEPVKWGREREDISGRETRWRINSCWFLRSPLDASTRTADGSIQNWSKLPRQDLKYQEIASRDFGVEERCADLGGWVCQRRWLICIFENH